METTLTVHSRWPRGDVSRAHFYGEARRWIYTFLPEGHEQVGKLAKTLQEAARNALTQRQSGETHGQMC